LLGEIVTALDECWTEDQHAELVFGIMCSIVDAFRFDLAVSFLGASEKQAAHNLLGRLCEVESLPKDQVTVLMTKFE
jgi:hypothetical protein